MDLSSILPLLLGGKNPEMAKILSAMNGKSDGGGGTADILASILANQSKSRSGSSNNSTTNPNGNSEPNMNTGSGGNGTNGSSSANESSASNTNSANLFSSMMGGGGQAEMLMNLMSSMNKQSKPSPPAGLSAIQKIAPNDILGVLLKHYNKK